MVYQPYGAKNWQSFGKCIKKQKSGRFCKECERRMFFQNFCLWCMKKVNFDIRIFVSDTISIQDSTKLRKYKGGIKKFFVEIISGWFPTKGPLAEKLSNGVEKSRIIDREKDEYHEVVKEYKTGKVIHECHEPLSKHKK